MARTIFLNILMPGAMCAHFSQLAKPSYSIGIVHLIVLCDILMPK